MYFEPILERFVSLVDARCVEVISLSADPMCPVAALEVVSVTSQNVLLAVERSDLL